MRQSAAAPAFRNPGVSRRPSHRSGTRATALVRALAVLTVAALAGCSRSALPPAAGPAAAHPQARPAAGPEIGRFHWFTLANSPLGAREDPIAAWADGQLLEFGGHVGNGPAASAGAAFSPATGRWRRVAPVPAAAGVNSSDPAGLSLDPATAWTGRFLAVANGPGRHCPAAAGNCWTGVALYDPVASRWSRLTPPRQLDGLEMSAVTWTGRDIVVGAVDAAASGTSQGRLAVAAYTPATRRWRLITPAGPRRHPPRYLALADTGRRLLLWSLWDRVAKTKDGFSDYAGIDVLAMNANGTWRNTTGHWPQNQLLTSPARTPDGLLVSPAGIWCGIACSPPLVSEPGYFANPATLARKTIPAGPLGPAGPAYVWAGQAVIAVNLSAEISGPGISIRPGDMARFDPVTSHWIKLPALPDHQSPSVTPVWTGTELLTLTSAGHLLALRD